MAASYQAMTFIGIDYGSKLAGTTAIASFDGKTLAILQSEKKKDADNFLINSVAEFSSGIIAMDAPLSLPGIYTRVEGSEDYHYREVDRKLGAMSPMFLGGLTARAMKLSSGFRQNGWQVYETYPAAIAKNSHWSSAYAKTSPDSLETLAQVLQAELEDLGLEVQTAKQVLSIKNYHQADACIALLTALKLGTNKAEEIHGLDGSIWI